MAVEDDVRADLVNLGKGSLTTPAFRTAFAAKTATTDVTNPRDFVGEVKLRLDELTAAKWTAAEFARIMARITPTHVVEAAPVNWYGPNNPTISYRIGAAQKTIRFT